MISSSGKDLLDQGGRDLMRSELFKRAVLVCPNLPEMNYFLESQHTDMVLAVKQFYKRFQVPVYLKGGHNDKEPSTDVLCSSEGIWLIKTEEVKFPLALHGTGCRLSSAICANLANGKSLLQSCLRAKAYMHSCISNPRAISVENSVYVLSCVNEINEDLVFCQKLV